MLPPDPLELAAWKKANRGILVHIARKVEVSQTLVTLVLKGERHNEEVLRLLTEAGAPVGGREECHQRKTAH